jgi:hypothetical protein
VLAAVNYRQLQLAASAEFLKKWRRLDELRAGTEYGCNLHLSRVPI